MERLARLQAARPWSLVLLVGAVSLVCAWLASQLELRTRYDQLLPDSQPSVIEMRRVAAKTNGSQAVMVVLEGADSVTLRAFGDALVPKLTALGPDVVSHAEDGIQSSRTFLRPRAGLFASRDDLEKLAVDLDARWDWEVSQATGSDLEEGDEPPKIDATELKKRFGMGDGKKERFPDGYFQSPDGHALVVVVGTPVAAGDLAHGPGVSAKIRAAVGDAQRDPRFTSVRVGFAGDLETSLAEYGAIKRDLFEVGLTGVGLVLLVVLIYFMRARALLVMAITILCGLAWTFGFTRLVIGHVNVATGFLFSIVAGNGINVGILYLARYYEERRAGRPADDAILITHRATWQSTLVAAVAAGAAYMSLSITDFRAFKHFAVIGAAGMLSCWVVTILLLPALLILVDSRTDHTTGEDRTSLLPRLRARGVSYGRIFAALVPRAPRLVVGLGIVVGLLGTYAALRYARSDPMEYDLAKVQNEPAETGEMYRVSDVATAILGEYKSAMVVLCDRPEQARMLKGVLDARWNAAPANAKPFEGVHTLYDFVPTEQEVKLPTLMHIGERLRRARDKQLVSDDDWKELETLLPPDDLEPYELGDLPADLARSFTEKDGTRGTLVLIQPTVGQNVDDLRYLIRYADSFRETKLPDGNVVRGSGRAVVFADILKAVTSDIPKAVALSLVMTFLTVVLTFRRGAAALSVLLALFVGLSAVGAYMYFGHVKINFLNFAALPITFGIGVDYAVNLMQRYHADGSRTIVSALETTGGAVVLCSLTTILGYLALVGSHNQAIGSLGRLAVIGEVSCLLAAVLVLPAGWYLFELREARKAKARALTR